MGRPLPDEKPREKPPPDLAEAAASWVSLCQRRTTSLAMGSRWYDETRAAEETEGFLSTMAVFMTRSMDWTVEAWEDVSKGGARGSNYRDSYVNNSAEGTDGVGTVNSIATTTSILHDCAGDHDDVLGGLGELLDDKVHHLAQAGIFVLEELGDSKEESSGLILREHLASVEQESNLCEENSASSGLNG